MICHLARDKTCVHFSATCTTIFYLGMFVGPTTAGFIVESYGFEFVSMIYCFFYIGGLLIDIVGMVSGYVK